MFRDLKSNNRGIVFVTVLIIIIVAMALTVSVLSLNISLIKSSEKELQYIQAKTICYGALSQLSAGLFGANPGAPMAYVETHGNTTFTVTGVANLIAPSPGLSNSISYVFNCAF